MIFDDVVIPRERVFLNGGVGSVEAYNAFTGPRMMANMTTQTTIRAMNKLEFSYGLGTLMAEAIGDKSPGTTEMLGEVQSYLEVTRNAVIAATEKGWEDDRGVWFLDNRALAPMRSLLATWFPRVNEILTLIGSHNLLATPSRADLDNPQMRPLIDAYMHGANGMSAERRASLFRLAWDYIGSALGGRNLLYERFYLTSAARNRIMSHMLNPDRSRGFALVESMLDSGVER